MTPFFVIGIYLALLLGLGRFANRRLSRTGRDYMLASHSIGPFFLLMSLFGTTMTAFALVGSTAKAFESGIVVYGMLASASGIVHSLCFYLLGVKLWTFARRHGYTTQIQFFRDRLESNHIGLVLFPVLVGLVIPYLLVGILGAGTTIEPVTRGAFPELFPGTDGGVPRWLGSMVICAVVLIYVFAGGMRGTAWANAFQTMVFMVLGVVTFLVIANKLGGFEAATQAVLERNPEKFAIDGVPPLKFLTWLLIPLSVGMFPHVFQHWLTARSAESFKLPIIAHPIFILIVWLPCVLLGVWATSAAMDGELMFAEGTNANAVLGELVARLTTPVLSGLLTAGILAAVMSSLDSQFLCLGTMFTEDIVVHYSGKERFSEERTVWIARMFIIAIVLVTYGISVSLLGNRRIFALGVWCFSGFAALVPLAVAAVYWRRLTKWGAYASVIATAASWMGLFAQSDFAGNPHYSFLGMLPVAAMTICSTAALVVVSLVTKPPSEETLRKFF